MTSLDGPFEVEGMASRTLSGGVCEIVFIERIRVGPRARDTTNESEHEMQRAIQTTGYTPIWERPKMTDRFLAPGQWWIIYVPRSESSERKCHQQPP
jgi:hypothetical protein